MKFATLLTGMAMVGVVTLGQAAVQPLNPALGGAAYANGVRHGISNIEPSSKVMLTAQATPKTRPLQDKIDMVAKNKGQIGSGDQLRRFFFGDLEPIGLQAGGAGTVVNLYNKANDVTFSYCSTYDVVVAVKTGQVKQFDPAEVK